MPSDCCPLTGTESADRGAMSSGPKAGDYLPRRLRAGDPRSRYRWPPPAAATRIAAWSSIRSNIRQFFRDSPDRRGGRTRPWYHRGGEGFPRDRGGIRTARRLHSGPRPRYARRGLQPAGACPVRPAASPAGTRVPRRAPARRASRPRSRQLPRGRGGSTNAAGSAAGRHHRRRRPRSAQVPRRCRRGGTG